VASMSIDTLRDLHARTYHGQNLIVAAAGNVQHEPFVELVERLFASRAGSQTSDEIATPGRTLSGEYRVARPTAQTHVVLGTGVPGHAHKDRYPLALLSSALGGGMSSRLFQKIREELGLCYSVYTYQSFYSASGLSGVYVGTRPATADAAVDAISAEMSRMANLGLSADELEQTKRQVKGQVMLSLESTGARLYRLASFALHREPFLGLNGLLDKIDSVTLEDVCRVAAEFYDPDRQLVVRLGPDATNGSAQA